MTRTEVVVCTRFLVIFRSVGQSPSFLMRDCSVEGFKPRCTAAPIGPERTQFVCFRVASILRAFRALSEGQHRIPIF
jgi:hypothetical protein